MNRLSGAQRPRLLCDADGCLFPSEEPAYDASAEVMERFLAHFGVDRSYTPVQLREEFVGLNFRATARIIATRHGLSVTSEELEHWVAIERGVVTRHLSQVLTPDPAVLHPLTRLSAAATLAVVSSSASERVDVCLEAAGLGELFPRPHRFSAEALQPPVSKPDPAVYVEAVRQTGDSDAPLLAVEDSVVGTRSAVAAGVPVIGLLQFVPAEEQASRRAEVLEAGACAVLQSWDEVADRARRWWGLEVAS